MVDFVTTALRETGTQISGSTGTFTADFSNAPLGLRQALRRDGGQDKISFVADLPAPRDSAVLTRTDPHVGVIARYVLDTALDPALPDSARPARRCGLIVTQAVSKPTVALLIRLRTHLTLPGRDEARTHVAEEARIVAFSGSPKDPRWLDHSQVDQLLSAEPSANVSPDVARNVMTTVLAALDDLTPHLEQTAQAVADELREAHLAVRQAARGERAGQLSVRGLQVEPQLPVDVLGVYVYRPAGGQR